MAKFFNKKEGVTTAQKVGIVVATIPLLTVAAKGVVDYIKARQKHKYREQEMEKKHELDKEKIRYKEELKKSSEGTSYASESVEERSKYEPVWESFENVMKTTDPNATIGYFPGTPIHKGDLCCIYSSTGQGKSILLMQMLISISLGNHAGIIDDNLEGGCPQKVYLYDSELTKEDFSVRYGRAKFNASNVKIVQSSGFDSLGSFVEHIRKTVLQESCDCVFAIDNMTDMFPRLSEEQVRKFKNDLDNIQREALSRGVKVTFVVVLHSVKNAKGTGLQEMAGSVNWNRLFRTVISINPMSQNSECKILRVEKDRSSSRREDVVLKIVETPYLHFERCVQAITEESMVEGDSSACLVENDIVEETSRIIHNVPFNVALQIKHMFLCLKLSFRKIVKRFNGKYGLKHANQIKRIVDDQSIPLVIDLKLQF